MILGILEMMITFPSMFCIMPAGGGVGNEAVGRMKKIFPSLKLVYVFYGSSEVGHLTASLSWPRSRA